MTKQVLLRALILMSALLVLNGCKSDTAAVMVGKMIEKQMPTSGRKIAVGGGPKMPTIRNMRITGLKLFLIKRVYCTWLELNLIFQGD